MATYSSHRLIMGKEEIDNFFCLIGDILNFFLQKCLLSTVLYRVLHTLFDSKNDFGSPVRVIYRNTKIWDFFYKLRQVAKTHYKPDFVTKTHQKSSRSRFSILSVFCDDMPG